MIHYETINEAGRELASRIQDGLPNYEGEAIVFIGALGICMRRMQSMVGDKYTDPALICVDTLGHWVIPVLSGHVGGANELARQIATLLGAQAVITTQSDNAGLWPLDTLAKEHGWQVSDLSRQAMNQCIARFVNREPTALLLEWDDAGVRRLRESCPEHVTIYESLEALHQAEERPSLVLAVSPHERPEVDLQYFPPCLHLGLGCQKMAPAEAADVLLEEVRRLGYAPQAIATVGTIVLKSDEPMLARLCELLPQAQRRIWNAEDLATQSVPNPSQKVFEVTGCYGVAEGAALRMAPLVVEKQKGCFQGSCYTFALAQDGLSQGGHIEIVGAGPGDPELISVRGRRFLEQADLILYAGSLVPRELTTCHKPGAVVRSSADMDLQEQFDLMHQFYDRGQLVVRLHTGDPCIYGAIQEQMAYFDRYGMHYHITPGISSFLAAAAELRSQFTIPEKCQSIILTRGEGRTPMPDREKLHLLAAHRSTMCIFLSASLAQQVQDELLAGGYPPDTPVAACYHLTWPDQHIYRGQLCNLASILRDNHLTLTTMIVVGEAIDNRQGLSRLYDGQFTHLFRKGKV